MGALSNRIDRFCHSHPNFGIPELMKYIAIGNVIVYFLDTFSDGMCSMLLCFIPSLIFQGQVWRIITFIFVPVASDFILWFIMSVFFYYWIGNALEGQWGTPKFTVFYLLGTLLNVILGLTTGIWVNMYYVNMSLFFAFASLYPDMQVYVMGILPLKVKWLAYLNIAFFAFDTVAFLGAGQFFNALLPVFAMLNYLIFFWETLMSSLGYQRQRAAHRNSAQAVNFKKAQKEVQQRKGYLHKCTVCGITDADHPDMEFRYCSKCNGYHCYCMDHLNNHDHIQ